jgi:transcriptional regulator with XRE-family HTH domain/Zn-dependent peptidase ImmA (M78 family)
MSSSTLMLLKQIGLLDVCRARLDPVLMAPGEPSLGDQLRRSRTDRGLSLREVERRSGINTGYLSQLERNEIANPSPSVLQKVADAYEEPFGVLMRWAGYVEDDPRAVSPNARRALKVLGDDFTDEELNALRAVLDVLRSRNSGAFSVHRNDLVLPRDEIIAIRAHARAVLRELDALDTDAPVDLDEALVVAKLVKAGVIELTLDERRRLRDRFRHLADWALAQLLGVVHFDSGQVYVKEELHEMRKRFVLGHEIGHGVLPDHRIVFAHLDDTTRLKPEFNDYLERQANQFAIELLAKGKRLNREFDDSSPSVRVLTDLHEKYGISLYGTARRVAEESRHAVAVAIAPRAQGGTGPLLDHHYKLYCSPEFHRTLRWDASTRPSQTIRTSLRLISAGAEAPSIMCSDAAGRRRVVTVQGIDAHFSVIALLASQQRKRLIRASAFGESTQTAV